MNANLRERVTAYRYEQILAAIRESTAVWGAPQGTSYYAGKLGYSKEGLRRHLYRMADLGLLERHSTPRSGRSADTWTVVEREAP